MLSKVLLVLDVGIRFFCREMALFGDGESGNVCGILGILVFLVFLYVKIGFFSSKVVIE